MKGYLCSQDGSYAFPLGPKVTTIGRENCDISINSPSVDHQHALLEYDNEQRCFILKDLNSSSGTYVHDCRVQNAAVRLADGDTLRFGFNTLPLEFRVEQPSGTSMPSIHQRSATCSGLQQINQIVPGARRSTSSTAQHSQQIDVQQNAAFCLRARPCSAGTKKTPCAPPPPPKPCGGVRDSTVRPLTNAWTVTSTPNPNRSIINASFCGEVDIPCPDNSAIQMRVEQLEREVKSRDVQIRELVVQFQSLESSSSTSQTEAQSWKAEVDKLKREKQTASTTICSLKNELHSKCVEMTKLTCEIESLKKGSAEKDLRLKQLQAEFKLLRDRTQGEAERYRKDTEQKLQAAEQRIDELTKLNERLKDELHEMEKRLLRGSMTEQKLKEENDDLRARLAECQRGGEALKDTLAAEQKKYHTFCAELYLIFEKDSNEHHDGILAHIRQLLQEMQALKEKVDSQSTGQSTPNEQVQSVSTSLGQLFNISTHEHITIDGLAVARAKVKEIDTSGADDNGLLSLFKQIALFALESHERLIIEINRLKALHENCDRDLEPLRIKCTELEGTNAELSAKLAASEENGARLEKELAAKDAFWKNLFDEERERLLAEIERIKREAAEEVKAITDKREMAEAEARGYLEELNALKIKSAQDISELTSQLEVCHAGLDAARDRQAELEQRIKELEGELHAQEKAKDIIIVELKEQVQIYKDQVRQFSITIVELQKSLTEKQELYIKLQADFEHFKQQASQSSASSSAATTAFVDVAVPVIPVVPVLTAPIADLSHELFAYKARVQEQEQIIISLRRDLAGMTARLSDMQGELSDKQKYALQKCESTVREQNKELNETRLKLSKLSDIVEKQNIQIDSLKSDLVKSKVLAEQYQLLVDQRKVEIERLTRSLDEKTLVVEQVEKNSQDEGRIGHELLAIGAQCKGERHEQTISRQREAVNELRARIRSLEQLRPVNPSYEKVLQQVVVLKRELAELRARQALPTDIPYLSTAGTSSSQHASQSHSSASSQVEQLTESQKIVEERTAHAATMNSLQSCDDLHNGFARRLIQILGVDDDSLSNVAPLGSLSTADRYVALQQRQRTTEILIQKIEMLRERLARKEELLRDYEKDLGKLRQAEILLREKNSQLQDLETDKRSKDDEALFLRNTLRETQDTLNQEKQLNSSIKLGRNVDQSQSSELIRRSGGSSVTLHHHCPPDASGRIRTIKRDLNQKIARKDYEIKTLKQELHGALYDLSEKSHEVRRLELQGGLPPMSGSD